MCSIFSPEICFTRKVVGNQINFSSIIPLPDITKVYFITFWCLCIMAYESLPKTKLMLNPISRFSLTLCHQNNIMKILVFRETTFLLELFFTPNNEYHNMD